MNTHLYHQTGTSAVTDCIRAAERIVRKHATPANSDGRPILRRAGFADPDEVRRAVLYMRVKNSKFDRATADTKTTKETI